MAAALAASLRPLPNVLACPDMGVLKLTADGPLDVLALTRPSGEHLQWVAVLADEGTKTPIRYVIAPAASTPYMPHPFYTFTMALTWEQSRSSVGWRLSNACAQVPTTKVLLPVGRPECRHLQGLMPGKHTPDAQRELIMRDGHFLATKLVEQAFDAAEQLIDPFRPALEQHTLNLRTRMMHHLAEQEQEALVS